MQPRLSIITINYNNVEGLKRTFDSVFAQIEKGFEYIVVDGGSSDGSKELIEECADKITYWVSESDDGVYNAMNKGIRVATGEYLLFLNSGDNLISADALNSVYPFLNFEEVVCFPIQLVFDDRTTLIKSIPSVVGFNFFYTDSLPHQSVFIKRTAFDIVGFYDESLHIVADWKWFVEAICFHYLRYKYINKVFSVFYVDGISADLEKLRLEKERVFQDFPKVLLHDAIQFNEYRKKIEDLERSRLFKLFETLKKIVNKLR